MKGWRWITAAGEITAKGCKLLGLVLVPSTTAAVITVYNGGSVSAPVVLTLESSTKTSVPIYFGDGLDLDRGLFIGSFTNVTGVLVWWEI